MLSIYVGCFVFGAVYAVLSAFLGHHGMGHSGVDHAGMGHTGMGHADVGHNGLNHTGAGQVDPAHPSLGNAGANSLPGDVVHTYTDDSSHDFPSPFNPLVIASAITTFGAIGIIGKLGFKLGEIMTAFYAASSSIITGTIIFYGIVKLMYSSQSNSSYSEEELVGLEAEVVTPIPEKGMGEISYVINGERFKSPAKTFNQENVTKGKIVRIYQMQGRIPLVIKKFGADNLDEIIPEIKVDEESQRNTEQNKRKVKGD